MWGASAGPLVLAPVSRASVRPFALVPREREVALLRGSNPATGGRPSSLTLFVCIPITQLGPSLSQPQTWSQRGAGCSLASTPPPSPGQELPRARPRGPHSWVSLGYTQLWRTEGRA